MPSIKTTLAILLRDQNTQAKHLSKLNRQGNAQKYFEYISLLNNAYRAIYSRLMPNILGRAFTNKINKMRRFMSSQHYCLDGNLNNAIDIMKRRYDNIKPRDVDDTNQLDEMIEVDMNLIKDAVDAYNKYNKYAKQVKVD